MSNGQNAHYLLRAAELLASLTARVAAASNEEQVLRYQYETLSQHSSSLEAECERLRNDIEGHVSIAGVILAERDKLRTALEAREAKLLEVGSALLRDQDQSARRSQTYEADLAELRAAFDREREELSANLKAREAELSELRLAFDRERDRFHSELQSREAEMAGLRANSGREQEALTARIDVLETKREELRLALDRISQLRVESVEAVEAAESVADRSILDPGAEAQSGWSAAQPGDRGSAVDQANAVVPKETLRQARAQFDFLARESFRRGDVATQAMCELGAHTIEIALVAQEKTDPLPVGEVAFSILTLPDLSSGADEKPGRRRADDVHPV